MAPSNEAECFQMLTFGYEFNGICAVRYPRGHGPGYEKDKNIKKITLGKANLIKEGKKVAILGFGTIINECIEIAEKLNATLIDMRFIKPIDKKSIINVAMTHDLIVTIEENTVSGGAGSAVLEVLSQNQLKKNTLCLGLPDHFPNHGSQEEILKDCNLDKKSIMTKIEKAMN